MVEHFFQHPYTLRYLRGGVTGRNIDSFAAALAVQRFKRDRARGLLRGVAHLGHWMEDRGAVLHDLDEELLTRFREHLGSCRCVRRNKGRLTYCRSGPNRFLRWARGQGLVPAASIELLPPLIEEFEVWMTQHRCVSPATLRECYRLPLRRFLDVAGTDPASYDAAGVRSFILAQSQRTGPSRAKQAVSALRMLLRHLAITGRCLPELVDAVPTLPHWKLGPLPRYLPPEVVEGMVESCDPATATGRRDRAVLLLLARLGLRAGDVTALCFADIDWRCATITVWGKSRRETRLPLPQDVGDALLAWIADGRPQFDDDHVFVTVRAPLGPLHRASVKGIVVAAGRRLARSTGATIPPVGPHLLRHTTATTLLRQGVSLPAIGALLRHQSLETTTIYAKVDTGLLATLASPWPEEVSP